MEEEESKPHDIYENLVDKICLMNKNENIKSVVDLFERACLDLNISHNQIFKEDINFLGLYSCQIILNNKDIFIKAVSGSSTDQAYENSIRKFINDCLAKRNLKCRFPEFVPESFYLELKDSIESIDLRDRLKSKMKEICLDFQKFNQLSMINSINYENIKKKIAEDKYDMKLTEIYRDMGDRMVVCTLLLNELLILQQGDGKDKKDALENTVREFFTAYEIISNENSKDVSMSNGGLNKEEVLGNLSNLFKEKISNLKGAVNYWDVIQDCLKSLHLEISVKSGEVKINDMPIVNVKEDVEYVGNIKVGKKFVEMLSQDRRKPEPVFAKAFSSKPATFNAAKIMNFPKPNMIYKGDDLEKQMRSMAKNANKEFSKDHRQLHWNVLNRECLRTNCKFDPCYTDGSGEKICALKFQDSEVISASGEDRTRARENAAKKFIDKYLQESEH